MGDDLGFQFGWGEYFHIAAEGEDFLVEVVGEQHAVAENGVGVVHFLALRVVERQGAEVSCLGVAHA